MTSSLSSISLFQVSNSVSSLWFHSKSFNLFISISSAFFIANASLFTAAAVNFIGKISILSKSGTYLGFTPLKLIWVWNYFSSSCFTDSNRSRVGLYSVASSNLFFGFSSYYFLIDSVFILRLSSLSFSISKKDFLNKCFGKGFAWIS